jgi:N-acetylglutamate synthase-like GNAT family acetyltransferase
LFLAATKSILNFLFKIEGSAMLLPDAKAASFKNLKDYWKTLAKHSTGEAVETTELVQVTTGIFSPLFNPFFLKESAKALPLTHFTFAHSFWYDAERNKAVALDAKHIEPVMEHVPMMMVDLDKEMAVNLPTGFVMERVQNNHDLSAWIQPVAVAFSMTPEMALAYQRCLESASDEFIHFVVKKEGVVVAGASLYLHPETAGFYNLGVLPEFRKQGIGTALHHVRMNAAREKGYANATLQATPMAAHLGASIGFETCSEVTIYKRR